MKNIIIIILLLFISGCNYHLNRITCSSGFDTGWNRYAYAYAGMIKWGNDYYHMNQSYTIKQGEICVSEIKVVGNEN